MREGYRYPGFCKRFAALPRGGSFGGRLFLLLISTLLFSGPVWANGSSPTNPLNLTAAGSRAFSIRSGQEVWFRVRFSPDSTRSHLELETSGSVDAVLKVYANLDDALQDAPIEEDDDSGPGLNAFLRAPLGFPSPYLVRVTSFNSGSSRLHGSFTFVAGDRCDWPAGCPLAVAAEGAAAAPSTLQLLRQVRGELLNRSERGRELGDLYWRLGKDLVPELLLDGEFRRGTYREVETLLPLAIEALAVQRGEGGGVTFGASHVDRLQNLVDSLLPRLSPELAEQLQSTWLSFRLREHAGRPVAEVLKATRLIARDLRPQTVLVKLRAEPAVYTKSGLSFLRTGITRLDGRLAAAGAKSLRRVHSDTQEHRVAGLTRTVAFEVVGLEAARTLVRELAADPDVEWAQISARMRIFGSADPYRSSLWGVDAVRAPRAWNSTRGNCSTRVAIVDTGLREEVADFAGRVLSNRGFDFADNDPDPRDEHGHGTHVAGTVAAALENATSVAGVAPGVCIFGVKVLSDDGNGTAEDVADGIIHAADQGARVINLSLGCDCEVQQVIEDAMRYAANRDVVIVAAAGNDGNDQLGYPASSSLAIAVGALEEDLSLASFSNYGPGLELVAPGVDVVSVFRDGESCTGSGTSMASPHVAGVAALVRSLNPRLDREEVREMLTENARDLGRSGYDTSYGHGLVDAAAAVRTLGAPACRSGECLSLHSGRFEVQIQWRDFAGNTGTGHVVPFGSTQSGLFWFFGPSNWEMLVKVLDGCAVNRHFWVFAAATTNVEYTLRVTDKTTGQTSEYFNPLGRSSAAITDTTAFRSCSNLQQTATPEAATLELELFEALPPSEALAVEPVAACPGSTTGMCLNQGRFRIEVNWRDFDGNRGIGHSVPFGSDDSGLLWFFRNSNWEMLVKVLDGCSVNGKFWVFAAATTNVEYTLRVTDTTTNRVVTYSNPLGRSSPAITDTGAFSCRR